MFQSAIAWDLLSQRYNQSLFLTLSLTLGLFGLVTLWTSELSLSSH